MPIYAYRCRACGDEFEKLVLSLAKAGSVQCPACQSKEIERRPALFGVKGGAGRSAAADCSTPAGGG